MRKRMVCAVCLALALLMAAASADTVRFGNYNQALKYVQEQQPKSLDLGEIRFKPTEVLSLKEHMPKGGKLTFSLNWCGTVITEKSTEIDLSHSQQAVNQKELEALLALCPKLKKMNLTGHRNLSNPVMIPLVEQYPDIEFIWFLTLSGRHSLYTNDTAYSTFNHAGADVKLYSSNLELLKYAPGLKALDLGHNHITSLDFLRYLPDLEFLILGDNPDVTDLTPLSGLKHLQYAEIFTLDITDVSPLAACTELKDLNLSFCKGVTDLSPILELPSLERFWGNKMALSDEQKAAFRAAYPNAEVIFDGAHATSDGWREHPRYFHYVKCFKSHVWIPFDQMD